MQLLRLCLAFILMIPVNPVFLHAEELEPPAESGQPAVPAAEIPPPSREVDDSFGFVQSLEPEGPLGLASADEPGNSSLEDPPLDPGRDPQFSLTAHREYRPSYEYQVTWENSLGGEPLAPVGPDWEAAESGEFRNSLTDEMQSWTIWGRDRGVGPETAENEVREIYSGWEFETTWSAPPAGSDWEELRSGQKRNDLTDIMEDWRIWGRSLGTDPNPRLESLRGDIIDTEFTLTWNGAEPAGDDWVAYESDKKRHYLTGEMDDWTIWSRDLGVDPQPLVSQMQAANPNGVYRITWNGDPPLEGNHWMFLNEGQKRDTFGTMRDWTIWVWNPGVAAS